MNVTIRGASANSLPSLKFIAKQILESIKNQLDDLIDREQTDFWSGSSRIDHINTLKAILEQCANFETWANTQNT